MVVASQKLIRELAVQQRETSRELPTVLSAAARTATPVAAQFSQTHAINREKQCHRSEAYFIIYINYFPVVRCKN